MDYNTIGQSFVKFYYETFDQNRGNLMSLYSPQSMMTFEGQQFQGSEAIIKKLISLPFTTVSHVITTIDCQPSAANGITVFVVGQLKTDNDPPHGFSQTFTLLPNPQTTGNYFVLNDMFRLSLHHG